MSYNQGPNYNNPTHMSTGSNAFDELNEYPCTFPYPPSSQAPQVPHILLSSFGHHASYEDFQPAGSGSSFKPFYQMIDQFEVAHGGIDDLRPRKEIINVPKRGVKRSASSANLDCGAATSRRRQEPLLQLPNNPQPDYRNELTLSLTCPADVGIDFSVEATASHRIPASDTVNDTGIGFDLVDDRYDWTPTLGQPRISSAEAVQVEANLSALDVDRRSMITPQPLSNRDISATSFAPPSSPVTISTVFAAPADNSQHVVAGSTPPLQAPSGRKARAQRKHKELKPSRLQPESKLNWTGVHQTNNTWDTTLSNPAANASIRRLRAAEADFEKSGTLLGPSSITASRRYPGKGNKEINADGDTEVNLDEIVGVLDNMVRVQARQFLGGTGTEDQFQQVCSMVARRLLGLH